MRARCASSVDQCQLASIALASRGGARKFVDCQPRISVLRSHAADFPHRGMLGDAGSRWLAARERRNQSAEDAFPTESGVGSPACEVNIGLTAALRPLHHRAVILQQWKQAVVPWPL